MTEKRKLKTEAVHNFMFCVLGSGPSSPFVQAERCAAQVFNSRAFITQSKLLLWENRAIYWPDMLIRPCVLVKQIEEV